MEMLNQEQVEFYKKNGYLVLPKLLPDDVIKKAKKEIKRLSEHAKTITKSDNKIDLEDSHTVEKPRIRRIKRPDLHSEFFFGLIRSDMLIKPVRDLIGKNVRLQTAKLNMKKAEFGAPVQWHQDWAFYPYTNDDVLALGIVFDDMDEKNGPLQVMPGTHKGPILDHHHNGYFVGSTKPPQNAKPVSIKGPAGTVSFHHARILHGSALNTSDRDRQMLFYELMAADAYPIMGAMVEMNSIEEFDSRMICGESTKQPRMTDVPIRIPLPLPPKAGSIYEMQAQGDNKNFEEYKTQ